MITITLTTSEPITTDQIKKYTEIFEILIEKGALDGIRGGSAILHFDKDSVFQGLELDYWPYRRRRKIYD